MDPCFLAEDEPSEPTDEEDCEGQEDADDAASEASSDFISNPDEDGIELEPFVRPSNPEPSDDDVLERSGFEDGFVFSDEDELEFADEDDERELSNYDADFAFSDDSRQEYSNYDADFVLSDQENDNNENAPNPIVRLPSRRFGLAPPMPTDEEQDALVEEAIRQYEEQTMSPPTSRYHIRASPDSWTGLDETNWGHDFYLASDNATMGVRSLWDAQSGLCHGRLMKCTWGGYEDRDRVPLCAAQVELKVTTPEGKEFWLDDCFTTYAPGSDDFNFEYVEFGHQCGETCIAYLERYGWGDFRPGNEYHQQENDEGIDELEGPEYMDQQVAQYSQNLLAAIPEEDDEEKGCVLETIAEEDEEGDCAVEFEDDEDDESDIEEVDMDLLDRIAAAVDEGGAVLREIAAETERERAEAEKAPKVKEEPLWMRDPTYVSGMRWSDMMDEDDEEF